MPESIEVFMSRRELYTRYQPGQQCRNCEFFQGASGQDWGPCSIFPGKLVAAGGWCASCTPQS